jgi:hypothetical protein
MFRLNKSLSYCNKLTGLTTIQIQKHVLCEHQYNPNSHHYQLIVPSAERIDLPIEAYSHLFTPQSLKGSGGLETSRWASPSAQPLYKYSISELDRSQLQSSPNSDNNMVYPELPKSNPIKTCSGPHNASTKIHAQLVGNCFVGMFFVLQYPAHLLILRLI